nr:hypothetical protein [uncultured Friedmanniella sp.]
MAESAERDEAIAWDRVGQFLENSGNLGGRVWRRSLDVWGQVADHMSTGRYRADDMAADTARAMVMWQENLADAWTLMTRPPQRQRYAGALPTAFLFFDRAGNGATHTLLDPVFIPVPVAEDHELPPTAEIALDGTSSESIVDPEKSSARAVEALLNRLVARRDARNRYVLETIKPGEDVAELIGGVYDGLVYLKDPPLPLANVRVVVEGPPPEV